MATRPGTVHDAAPFVPNSRKIEVLSEAARSCEGCPLYLDATQTVFGAGPKSAKLLLVGEQPGDQEDKQGHPFVGPAGRVLWDCVADAGLDPLGLYVTNAVKHFKHEQRGKRRIHKRPTTAEVNACHPWLDAELAAVDARVVVALGAVAARALLGSPTAIGTARGRPHRVDERDIFVTYHPSAVLRAEGEERWKVKADLTDDLRLAARRADV